MIRAIGSLVGREAGAESLAEARPELALLPSEPYPFCAAQLPALRRACVGARLAFVDGEMFSWYGSRLLLAGEYLRGLAKQLD